MTKDFVGKEAKDLRNKKLFLFDMDGTIYEEDNLFECVNELLDKIDSEGGRYVFITNNSSKSVKDYIDKLNRLGIKADEDNFFTSGQATAIYLKNNYPNAIVYCQATESLVEELTNKGVKVVTDVCDEASVVVVGFDTELTTAKLRNTCEMLQKDVPFIATNPDLRCPVSFGYVPDCAAICKMIEYATDKKPTYIGKPAPTMVNIVRQKYGYSLEEVVVIGDRLYTDIATGLNAGVTSICVLTGEATLEEAVEGDIKPTYIFEDIKAIYDVVK